MAADRFLDSEIWNSSPGALEIIGCHPCRSPCYYFSSSTTSAVKPLAYLPSWPSPFPYICFDSVYSGQTMNSVQIAALLCAIETPAERKHAFLATLHVTKVSRQA